MAPLSQNRIYQALKQLMPPGRPAWKEDGSRTTKELNVIAYALGEASDLVEPLLDELMPDTTNLLASRWISFLQIDTRPTDQPADKQARILAKLRRQVGYTVALLQAALATPLALTSQQVQLVEVVRQQVEDAMTFVSAWAAEIVPGAPGLAIPVGLLWPGSVDDTGTKLTFTLTGAGSRSFTVTLKHADGTAMTYSFTGVPLPVTYSFEERLLFLKKPAAGPWTILFTDTNGSGAITLSALRLRVSNDIDAAQIFQGYAFRDPALGGTPDLLTAQPLLTRTAIAHALPLVCQRLSAIFDDALTLIDRDPVGA